jgi:AAA domain
MSMPTYVRHKNLHAYWARNRSYGPFRPVNGEAAADFVLPSQSSQIRSELKSAEPKLVAINLLDFVAQALPQRQYVLAPILPERGLAMLVASRGVGKTQVAFNIGWAVACGQPFLRWYAPQPRRVLYVDGEMPQELLQERAKAMMGPAACEPPHPDFFRLLSMDRQDLGVSLNLALPEHQAAVETHLDNVDLLILDNISTLVNSGRENDAESWNEMQAWLLRLRRMGKTVLLGGYRTGV